VLVKDGPRPFVGSHADYGEDPSAHGFYNAGEARLCSGLCYGSVKALFRHMLRPCKALFRLRLCSGFYNAGVASVKALFRLYIKAHGFYSAGEG
jgi:hypothetical protein